MPLQFLLGAGQNDSVERMVQTAEDWLKQNIENRVFFIVPNYNKFEQEIHLLSAMKKGNKFLVSSDLLGIFYSEMDRFLEIFYQKPETQ
jgi:ATP-dependent helicase/nuclease subunit B